MQITVANPEKGKTYQKEIEDKKARVLHGKKIGEEVEGSLLDLKGYKLKITGGSDKQGFPMKKGVKTEERTKLLLGKGPGYRPKETGIRKRKTVRGEIVSEETQQLNLKVVSKGKKNLAKLFGEEPEEEEEETVEETDEEEKEAEEETEETKEEVEEEAEEEVDFEELSEKNTSEVKEKAADFSKEQYKKLLEAEKQNKDRKTMKKWINKQLED
ncbi:MAG: 30S ribosomal protein S6e [archaeon]